MKVQECESCGATEWIDSRCAYCRSLHSHWDYLIKNPGKALVGTWQNGIPIDVTVWEPKYEKRRKN